MHFEHACMARLKKAYAHIATGYFVICGDLRNNISGNTSACTQYMNKLWNRSLAT